MFADRARIFIRSGKGGDGHVSFRRELYVPDGGPDGGDGGKGGDLIFVVDPGLNTLVDYRHKRKYCAGDGKEGSKKKCTGASGEDMILKVPAGTVVKDAETGKVILDMANRTEPVVLLKGGRGGKGNQHYATATMQAPKYAQPGQRAKELWVDLELKVIADVGLIGFPNVGKSTLMNQLIGQKIAITSSKAQTTRNRIQTVYTSEEGQIVFLDTPGINKAKNKLGDYMLMAAERTLNEVDLILWLVEPTTFIGGGEQYIIEKLQNVKTPIFLVINKTDIASEEEVLKAIVAYKDQCNFAEIIPVSALEGNNTDDLVHSIFNYLPEGPMYYDEDTITDQPERQIVAELVREKALRLLSQEIPHGIAVVIERMKNRKGRDIVDIEAVIVCERESHKRIIIGKKGSMIKEIGTQAREEMENLLDTKVNLKLWVKVRKDWRDSDILLKNYGYNKKEL